VRCWECSWILMIGQFTPGNLNRTGHQEDERQLPGVPRQSLAGHVLGRSSSIY